MLVRIAAILLCLIAVPRAAQADPLRLTGFGYFVDFEGDFFLFQGAGFTAQSEAASIGVFPPKTFAGLCVFCDPGQTVDLSFTTPGEVFLGTGNLTTGGQTFTDVSFSGSLIFTAEPFELPDPAEGFVRVTTPFTFTGSLRATFPTASGTGEVFTELVGSGLASANYADNLDGRWAHDDEGRINYVLLDAAPVPEPTSMLLVATGLCGALARGVRMRRARR